MPVTKATSSRIADGNQEQGQDDRRVVQQPRPSTNVFNDFLQGLTDPSLASLVQVIWALHEDQQRTTELLNNIQTQHVVQDLAQPINITGMPQPQEVHIGATNGNGEILSKPYPKKYNNLAFPQYDGKKGSVVEHVSKFLDAMGAYARDRDLCLCEFSKSLSDKAYTWYTTLLPGSIRSWDEMPNDDDKCNPKYCRYHRFVYHVTMDCFSLRRIYHRRVLEGLLEVPNRRKRVEKDPLPRHAQGIVNILTHIENAGTSASIIEFHDDTPTFSVRAFQQTPKFKMLFDQLGFTTEAILTIANETGGECLNVEAHANRAYLESSNAITFIDQDMEAPYPDHRKPFYLSAQINFISVRHALVDIGSFLNLIPLNTITVARISQRRIIRSLLSIVGFGSSNEHALGYIQLELKGSPIVSSVTASSDHFFFTTRKNISIDEQEFYDGTEFLAFEVGNKVLVKHLNPAGEADHLVPPNELPTLHEAQPALTYLEPLKAVNLGSNLTNPKNVHVSAMLSVDKSAKIVDLLWEYKDVFAWHYDEMPGLDPTLGAHFLNVDPNMKLVVSSAALTFATSTRLVPNMDVLMDNTIGYEMYSLMDGSRGYNKVSVLPNDVEKIAFHTPISNFNYVVMPFGLKNAEATYQRVMVVIFHNFIHIYIEIYINDIVVKSKTRLGHFNVLRKVFDRCRLYKLKMNPAKCAFGVSVGKFLGFLVSKHGISVDSAKFIPSLEEILSTFSSLLKQEAAFTWTEEQQCAFLHLQSLMLKLPTISVFVQGKPLKVYLSMFDKAGQAVADLLSEFSDEVQYPISEEVPSGEVTIVQKIEEEWTLYFDGSSTVERAGVGAGVVLRDDTSHDMVFSFKLDFQCINNTADQRLEQSFASIRYEQVPQMENRLVGALATIASKVPMIEIPFSVQIAQKEQPVYRSCKSMLLKLPDRANWRHKIYSAILQQKSDIPLKDLPNYILVFLELYYRLPSGI
ncbi:hypothetical protein SLEP1_g16100 [Rubroshorea leprosula]|uniref:Reverse transcriptase domain-containing protein n=1 Tax=Rubroshorea leprosula TaxID=152421 RepID=A0AAV5IXD0_9ROSI|nr:hypothetical protein SLEP1_g16100 [Rubroshorea leprosula]